MTRIQVTDTISIDASELEFSAMRSSGAGGQHVNKVSSAVHLRFNIMGSSLTTRIKKNLLNFKDSRITEDGFVVIKAQQFRSQEQNKQDAIQRLGSLIQKASHTPKKRKPTKPSRASNKRRLDGKGHRSKVKNLRKKVH